MQHTLLTIVQDMLGAIDAEGVTDVTDTEEANLCVLIANRAYESLIYEYKWKHLRMYTNLIAGTENNELKGPSNTIHINSRSVYYDGDPVCYLKPEDFVALTQARTVGTNISIVGNTKTITNQNPTYFTSFDDTTLVFDATPTTSALTPSSSNAIVWIGPSQRLSTNSEIFNIPAIAYPALEDMAIGMAISELKGDTQTGDSVMKEAKSKLTRLTQKGDLIEKRPDILEGVITRRSTTHRKVLNVGDIS